MSVSVAKVKTYQPEIPDGKGPVCNEVQYAMFDIVMDLNEQNNAGFGITDLNALNAQLVKILNVSDWIEGEYIIFEDYKMIIKTYAQYQLDEMKEFNGY